MKKSKLELYLDILKTLGQRRRLNLSYIVQVVNVEKTFLNERVDFLISQRLVEQTEIGKEVTYSMTQRGLRVFAYFQKTCLQ